jgi:hypothetical protein
MLEHRPIGDNPAVHGLEAAGVPVKDAVSCPLKLGGATLHHGKTLHYSAPNVSGRDRLAYTLVFLGRVRRRLLGPRHVKSTADTAA